VHHGIQRRHQKGTITYLGTRPESSAQSKEYLSGVQGIDDLHGPTLPKEKRYGMDQWQKTSTSCFGGLRSPIAVKNSVSLVHLDLKLVSNKESSQFRSYRTKISLCLFYMTSKQSLACWDCFFLEDSILLNQATAA
jgi:hypothetical protein